MFKWMSPESLKNLEFSVYSDVWSYGICLWEIFSLGKEPFHLIHNHEMLLRHYETGERLPRPEFCTPEMYVFVFICIIAICMGLLLSNNTILCKGAYF